MKKRLAKIFIALLVIAFLLLAGGVYSRKIKAENAAHQIEYLPDFTLPSLNGKMFNSGEIASGPILITYFHPECDHCQYEISSILSSNLPEEDLKIILVSPADPDQVKSFVSMFDIKHEYLVWILSDTSHAFSRIFQTEIIPANYIYDKNLHLVKTAKGVITVEAIYKSLD
jgi:peroxiredoxin